MQIFTSLFLRNSIFIFPIDTSFVSMAYFSIIADGFRVFESRCIIFSRISNICWLFFTTSCNFCRFCSHPWISEEVKLFFKRVIIPEDCTNFQRIMICGEDDLRFDAFWRCCWFSNMSVSFRKLLLIRAFVFNRYCLL